MPARGAPASAAVAPGEPQLARAPEGVPDFFVVGHQKCGTSALYLTLSAHPQIFLPDVKEPWFFARELRSRWPSGGGRGRPNTLESYLSLFAEARPGQRLGEASPQYIRSEVAARDIAQLRPDARIVAIFREPAGFLRSLHLQFLHTHMETEGTFEKAMALEPERREGRHLPDTCVSPQSLLYSDHIRYTEQLRRFYDAFPREQVLVLIYEDFRRDNESTVGEVLRFLDVDDTVGLEMVETKPLKAVRSMPLHDLRRTIRKAGLHPAREGRVVRAIDAIAPPRLRSRDISAMFRRIAYTQPAPPDPAFMERLRRRFKPEVVAFSEYLGRDLVTLWGYDRLS